MFRKLQKVTIRRIALFTFRATDPRRIQQRFWSCWLRLCALLIFLLSLSIFKKRESVIHVAPIHLVSLVSLTVLQILVRVSWNHWKEKLLSTLLVETRLQSLLRQVASFMIIFKYHRLIISRWRHMAKKFGLSCFKVLLQLLFWALFNSFVLSSG